MERRPGSAGAIGPAGYWRDVLLGAGIILLPGMAPATGGLVVLVPLAFLLLCDRRGTTAAARSTAAAMSVAGIASLTLGQFGVFLLTCSFVLSGMIMGWAGEAGVPPVRTGAWGLGVLAGGWLFLWGLAVGIGGHDPYAELVRAVDQGMQAAFTVSLEQAGVPPEARPEIEAALDRSREMMPTLLPGILLASLAGCVWTVLVLFRWLGGHAAARRILWPPYRCWRLPEGLVWLAILLGVGFLLPSTRTVATAGLLVVGVLYFFQGLAVVAALLERWQLPPALRIVAYVVILAQLYGVVLVAALGLADVWADFGRAHRPPGE